MFFFCKQKTAYEMRISDWSSDVCSSDLPKAGRAAAPAVSDRSDGSSRRRPTPGRRPPDDGGERPENPLSGAPAGQAWMLPTSTRTPGPMVEDREMRLMYVPLDRKSTRLNSSH